MNHLLTFSLRYRFFTLVAIAVVMATGIWSFTNLTIDAVPDLTPVQVQVLTRAPALGPVEVEQFVTFPIEASLNGLPALRELRSGHGPLNHRVGRSVSVHGQRTWL